MRRIKKVLSIVLLFTLMCGSLDGCGKQPSLYITKGEFFSLFISKGGMYSYDYSAEEIENDSTYGLAAKTMLEWELIDEDQLKSLNANVTKELVVQSCIRFMGFRQEYNDIEIKDIDKCHDKQAIKDAVGMGIVTLSNGYFDAYQGMTYEDCISVIEKANDFEYEVTFENSLDFNYKDGVESLDGIEILGFSVERAENNSSKSENSNTERATSALARKIDYFHDERAEKITKNLLASGNTDATQVAYNDKYVDYDIYRVTISSKSYFENKSRFEVGNVISQKDVYKMAPQTPDFSTYGGKIDLVRMGAFCGVITSVEFDMLNVVLVLREATVEEFVCNDATINQTCTTYAQSMPADYQPDKEPKVPEGFKIAKTSDGKGVTASYKHTFSLSDNSYPDSVQQWRNAEAKPHIELSATVNNFKVNSTGLGFMLLHMSKNACINISFDSRINVSADSGGLRFSPANNGNGKFFSNFSNSRWTGASAGGSKEIKVGTTVIPLGYTGFSIEIPVYLYVQMDGSLSYDAQKEHNIQCKIHSGHVTFTSTSKDKNGKKNGFNVTATVETGIHSQVNLLLLHALVIDSDIRVGVNINASASVYADDNKTPEIENVHTTVDDLKDAKVKYCIDSSVSLVIRGKALTKKSLIGELALSLGMDNSPDFSFSQLLYTSHFEDGHNVTACSRCNTGAVTVNKKGKIIVSDYKVNMCAGDRRKVQITSMPVNDKTLNKNSDGVNIKAKKPSVANVMYDVATKTIYIDGLKSGSTEIVLSIKVTTGWWFWKETKQYKEEISVTVTDTPEEIATTDFSDKDVVWIDL